MDYRSFELLCADLIKLANPDLQITTGYRVPIPSDSPAAARRPLMVDIVGFSGSGLELVAEVKAYRSLRVPTDWLIRAAQQLEQLTLGLNAKRSILMVAARLSALQQKLLSPQLEIIDFDSLYALANGQKELISRLDTLLGEAVESGSSDAVTPPREKTRRAASLPVPPTVLTFETRGQELCATLDKIMPGRAEATNFERTVQSCLEYIFEGQLANWNTQPTLDDRLRSDIAAKIVGKHDFWRDLIRDFGTRFILFECKNYSSAISQEQVYSTEKYLFRPALRSVAVFISPLGADEGALAAMKGAVRESGKLMLSLRTSDLCDMLRAKDEGSEVHEILGSKLDNMLITIAR